MTRLTANHPMSRTAGSAFGSAARAGVIAALPAVGYLKRSHLGGDDKEGEKHIVVFRKRRHIND
jgi:hypothetical protein